MAWFVWIIPRDGTAKANYRPLPDLVVADCIAQMYDDYFLNIFAAYFKELRTAGGIDPSQSGFYLL